LYSQNNHQAFEHRGLAPKTAARRMRWALTGRF
jgi:hypothetical protein